MKRRFMAVSLCGERQEAWVRESRTKVSEQRRDRRRDRERPEQAVLAVPDELDQELGRRGDGGERDAAGARARRGLGVGDHVEGEDQERSALELAQRDGEWVAEPERALEQEGAPGDEKRRGDV